MNTKTRELRNSADMVEVQFKKSKEVGTVEQVYAKMLTVKINGVIKWVYPDQCIKK